MPAKPNPAKAEALGDAVEFEYDGETYTIAPAAEWDLDALEAFENDKVVTCVRLLLGPGQWKQFKAKPRTVGNLNEMFAALQTHGLGTGN